MNNHFSPLRVSGRVNKRPRGEPSHPKKPLSAYNIFFKAIRPQVVQDLGGQVSFDKLGRIVGERWRATSLADRKVYEQKADEDVLRYRKEMIAYNEERRKLLDERRLEREVRSCGKDNIVQPKRLISPYK